MGVKWSYSLSATIDGLTGWDGTGTVLPYVVTGAIQLSDGTLVCLANANGSPQILYSSTHSSIGGTLSPSVNASGGIAICRDASDNIYVFSSATSGNTLQGFTKGSGYTWTAGNPCVAQYRSGQAQNCDLIWANCSGVTGGVLMRVDSISGDVYTYSASAVLGATSGQTINYLSSYTGIQQNSYTTTLISPQGFGGTQGIIASNVYSTSPLPLYGYSLSSSGIITISGPWSFPSTSNGYLYGLVYVPASSQWVVLSGNGFPATSWVLQISSGSALVGSASSLPSGTGFTPPTNPDYFINAMPALANDPSTNNQVWVYGVNANTSGEQDIYRLAAQIASGSVTWSASAVVDDTSVGWTGTSGGVNSLRVVRNPSGSIIDYQLGNYTQTTIIGDYTTFTAPPTAPLLNAPANGSYADIAATGGPFTGTYETTVGTNTQTGYQFRVKVSGGTYQYWNASTSALQSTAVTNAYSGGAPGTQFSLTLPANTLADNTTYNWSFACQDQGGLGPFASDFTVYAQAAPTVTVTAPTGTEGVSQPGVTWTVTTATGTVQTSYQVIIYNQSQYTAPGFTPGSSPYEWSSGVISNPSTSTIVGTPLQNLTNYRAYVQISETNNMFSTWAYSSFALNFPPPATPTIVATATTDPTTGAPMIQVVVSGHDNVLTANQSSLESGATTGWAALTNTTISTTTQSAVDGSYSLEMTASASGAIGATTPTGTSAFPVNPSQEWTAMSWFRAGSTAYPGRTCTVDVTWYDFTGTVISTVTAATITDSSTSWTQAIGQVTSPSNAAFASLSLNVAGASSAEYHLADAIGLNPGVVSAWTKGGVAGLGTFSLLRSDGLYVRGASPSTLVTLTTPSQQATLNDYEAYAYTNYTYSCAITASGFTSAVATSDVAELQTTLWWELDPLNPGDAVAAQVVAWNPQVTEQSAAHMVMGQPTLNIIANVMGGMDGSCTFETFTAPVYAGLLAVLQSQRTIFVSSPFGSVEGGYVRFGPETGGMSTGNGNKVRDAQLMASTSSGPHRTLSASFVAQTRPPV